MPCQLSRKAISILVLAGAAMCGCDRPSKPLEITESGWVIGCADSSPVESQSRGHPWMLFSTDPLGHFDTITFAAAGTPPCASWKKMQSTTWDLDHRRAPDYELTRVQHTDWLGRTDGTWDLVKMKSLTAHQ